MHPPAGKAAHAPAVLLEELLKITNSILAFRPTMSGYGFESVPTPLASGSVGMFIDETLNYRVKERTSNEAFQALWIEVLVVKKPWKP